MPPRADVVTVFCCGTNFSRDRQEEAVADMYRWCDGRKWINDGPGAGDRPLPKIEHLFKEGQEPSWWQNLRGTGPYAEDGNWSRVKGLLGGRGTQDNVLTTLQWLWLEYHRQRFTVCNLTGWSRGAVTCIAIANAMQLAGFAGLGVRVNIFAYDPVPGGSNDFGVRGTFAETGRAGIDNLASIVNNYHSILMENVGGAKGLLFTCISPQETSQETHKREYPLPGAHGDCVRWAKPSNPAGKLGLTLGMEFLLQNGSFFGMDAGEHFLTYEEMLEEYSKLRRDWLQACDWQAKPRDVAWARSGTVVNEWRHACYFINGHHFEVFQQAMPDLYRAAASTRVVSQDLVARLKARMPLTISVLRYLKLLRDPGSRVADRYRDVVFDIEVAPTPQEIAAAFDPLQAALANARPYNKTRPPASSDRIWTLEQWRQASSVTLGSRKEQVAEIDRLLPLYHEAGRRNRVGQFRLLSPLAEQITSHLTHKGTRSDRHVEMAQLGRQVLYALQHPPASAG
jgi:hypothetical protein